MLRGLDELRGVAIISVLTSHFYASFIGATATLVCGNAGVVMFFFISGFLIDRAFLSDSGIAAFFIRRVFRIFPMYWASVVLIAAVQQNWTWHDILANLTLSPNPARRMSGVYWTLYVETLFYLIVPFVLSLGRRVVTAMPAVWGAFFLLREHTGTPMEPMYFYLLFCFAGLQIGAWHRGAIRSSALFLCIGGTSLLAGAASPVGVDLGFISAACAIALLLTLHYRPKCWLLSLCGEVSYSWYLIHAIFGYTTGWAVAFYIGAVPGLTVGLGVTFAVSYITRRLIEKPFILLGKATAARISVAHPSRTTGNHLKVSA